MASNRADVLRKAEKLLRTGKLDLAIEEYVRLVGEQPRDWNARHTLGDLYVRANRLGDAVAQYAPIADHFLAGGALPNAAAIYRKIVAVAPDHPSAARGLEEIAARLGVSHDPAPAAPALDISIAADDPIVRLGRLETALRAGNLGSARRILDGLPTSDAVVRARVLEIGWTLSPVSPGAAYLCIENAVDDDLATGNYIDAAAILEEYTTRVPGQIVALLKLVDICVDGGLEATMYETQARLADAYLELGQGAEARAIAEGLVAREPWEQAHIDRFRRALIMSNVPDPDTVIAERLSGKGPFVATDPFSGPVRDPEPPSRPSPTPERDPAPEEPPVDEPPPEQPPRREPEPDIPLRRRSDAPAPAGRAKDVEIDLTDVLSELQGMSSHDAPAIPVAEAEDEDEDEAPDEALDGRRSEVSRQAGVQEAAEQLALGHTYLDMGMADEAIAALTRAAKIPAHRFEAASLLGRLYLKQDDAARAVEWLERAAEAPAPSVDEGRELMYDLGATLETTGEVSRALAVFMELQADAGEYRDVAARVDRLVQTGG